MRADAAPPWLREWISVEREATLIRWFEPSLVPGLVQTEAYARVVLRGGRMLRESEVEQRITSRTERQAILARETPPEVVAVIDEAVLRRAVAEPPSSTPSPPGPPLGDHEVGGGNPDDRHRQPHDHRRVRDEGCSHWLCDRGPSERERVGRESTELMVVRWKNGASGEVEKVSAVMSTDAEGTPDWPSTAHVSADELARRQGVEPVANLDELARPGLFESDDELDRFLADLYASRREGIA
ncbi:Scr1 family TA system antitoxin-like transcriptional regulator [Micromonospora sp. NPDC049240]|uniref:Scr1 family TA system antitoxin-like transcriptional regulator n=1 Tax=Micromonospora sp. NPDC049240 TaxID=3155151 RepID=UPI0033FE64B5